MLQDLNGADELEASVRKRPLVGRACLEGEVVGAAVPPLLLQAGIRRVDTEHLCRRELSGEALGDDSLATAYVEEAVRRDALSRIVEPMQEPLEQSADDGIRRL